LLTDKRSREPCHCLFGNVEIIVFGMMLRLRVLGGVLVLKPGFFSSWFSWIHQSIARDRYSKQHSGFCQRNRRVTNNGEWAENSTIGVRVTARREF